MRTLFVSFIGNSDCNFIESDKSRDANSAPDRLADESPIIRFVRGIFVAGCRKYPVIPAETKLILLDDAPDDRRHIDFVSKLKVRLQGLEFQEDQVEVCRLDLPGGPTDRDKLYTSVWDALPSPSTSGYQQHFLHLSSGTPSMQTTMILAASCLSLPGVRLFETSNLSGRECVEVELPYLLGLRERAIRERTAVPRHLDAKASESLMKGTICVDPAARNVYAALYTAARRKPAQRLLVKGPTGSGKYHAASQFVVWRKAKQLYCASAVDLPDTWEDGACLVIRRLDAWPAEALERLSNWCVQFSNASVVATWRTDRFPAAGVAITAQHGLLGASPVELPALSQREDIPELAASLARKRGILAGKLYGRFQFDFLTDNFPRGMHDLETLVATIADHSDSEHPEEQGRKQAERLRDADTARIELREIFEAIAGSHFGKGLPTLDDRLETLKVLTVRIAAATGKTNKEVAELLGYKSASAVTKIRNRSDTPNV